MPQKGAPFLENLRDMVMSGVREIICKCINELIINVFSYLHRLPFMCDDEFTVEDFQTFGVSDDEHYLPDILPPENKYGHEPNPRDSRLNLPPYKCKNVLTSPLH